MPTLRQIVSELATDVKATNLDDRVSFRYLASKFNSKLDYFLRLEFKSREFAKSQNIWQPIACVELEEVNSGACGFIDKCTLLKRSVCKIPTAYSTNYGLLLKVLTIDGREAFKLINNSSDYKDYITRRWAGNLKPVFLENKYLYVPDLDIQAVKLLIIAKNLFELDLCKGALTNCSNPLDAEVPYPDYLITLAKKEVYNEILNRTNVREDEKGDDNTNQKN